MDRRPILFIDSGIGGIPYCGNFRERNPAETVVYLADHLHFPYGKRSKKELAAILGELLESLTGEYDPKISVMACNTASVSALAELRERFPSLAFVGTVPAIKPAVEGSLRRMVGVLGTERTIDDPYIAALAGRYGSDCRIVKIAAPELVEFVENRITDAGAEEKRQAVSPFLERFREAGVDALVLGCTHFLFLLEEFRREAGPGMRVYDSVEGITKRVESLLDKNDAALRAPERKSAEGVFLVSCGETGTAGEHWQNFAAALGLRFSAFRILHEC
jgi:glutamate racemase